MLMNYLFVKMNFFLTLVIFIILPFVIKDMKYRKKKDRWLWKKIIILVGTKGGNA